MVTPNPFTPEGRREFLQEFFEMVCWLDHFADGGGFPYRLRTTPAFEAALKHRNELTRQLRTLALHYEACLPLVPLSRCPYCQTVNRLPFDSYDLDGIWWHCETDYRDRERQQLCPHFLTLSGAVKLPEQITWSPLEVLPGPEVPFIVPHMLEQLPVKAVISQIQVGAYTAYPIVYFSEVKPITIENPCCEWSKDGVAVLVEQDSKYEALSSRYYDYLEQYADFELAPWIEQGKVLWIEPEDKSLHLRSAPAPECPYYNLPGSKDALRIKYGCAAAKGELIRGKKRFCKDIGWKEPTFEE